MFMPQPYYPVSAHALCDSRVVAIDRQRYRDVMSESTETAAAVLGQLVARIQALLDEIEALSLQNGRYRLLLFLLNLLPQECVGSTTVRLPAKKTDIASRLSVKPESLSRLFRELAQSGLLTVDGRIVKIPNVGALRESIATVQHGAHTINASSNEMHEQFS